MNTMSITGAWTRGTEGMTVADPPVVTIGYWMPSTKIPAYFWEIQRTTNTTLPYQRYPPLGRRCGKATEATTAFRVGLTPAPDFGKGKSNITWTLGRQDYPGKQEINSQTGVWCMGKFGDRFSRPGNTISLIDLHKYRCSGDSWCMGPGGGQGTSSG